MSGNEIARYRRMKSLVKPIINRCVDVGVIDVAVSRHLDSAKNIYETTTSCYISKPLSYYC